MGKENYDKYDVSEIHDRLFELAAAEFIGFECRYSEELVGLPQHIPFIRIF